MLHAVDETSPHGQFGRTMSRVFLAVATLCVSVVLGCAVDTGEESPSPGDCDDGVTVVATGEHCDGVRLICAEGSYCDLYGGTAVCFEQKPVGSICDAAFECLSRACDGHCAN